MPDMHAVFNSPRLDLSNAPSQLFKVPASTASTSLYSLSVSRKRPRRNTEKHSAHNESNFTGSPMIQPNYRSVSVSGGNDLHASAELDYRPNRYRESFLPPSFDSSDESANLADYNGSRKRSRRDSGIISAGPDSPSTTPTGWGQTVIKAVSKVLDLCWTGAFRGFYAGGGQGYDMSSSPATTLESSWLPPTSPSAEKDMYSPSTFCSTPVPGQYPDDEVDPSWVVVPGSSDAFAGSELASPSLRTRRAFRASSPRRKSAVMPRLTKRTAYSVGPHSPTKGQGGLPSPRLKDAPVSADIQRQAAKMRRKEREEDASLQRLNKQLQAMIREGKEALGTTVVVDDVDMYDSD
ncbi:hypothetical protein DTO013E5_7561 [Penicillium roqueforti]|uniref:Uncharacterized protein n=1 Tax=Penicillium roqueforti (strain FM164) TaxID=1365484 RepID=W6QLL0_PENRF|nr:uncharacterized protein LCP9604111_8097 [Penicillium roqueforti]CDM37315.1 unnamed protein product [Penicillium roqueforti FM164]KAF9242189.1 hypothetical protein LCP9604111_8097 [Penicillium roqueforti]KAI1833355.1 hypothetical protein CBS147337_5853 [Penicillium roqueforti]KAI2671853.1 hypothetical protein CBS147355_8496 [Penicillium roqueforti]KAI2675210.1 hypothetical protein LCP963914a_8613 [Penicillium roqueforti]